MSPTEHGASSPHCARAGQEGSAADSGRASGRAQVRSLSSTTAARPTSTSATTSATSTSRSAATTTSRRARSTARSSRRRCAPCSLAVPALPARSELTRGSPTCAAEGRLPRQDGPGHPARHGRHPGLGRARRAHPGRRVGPGARRLHHRGASTLSLDLGHVRGAELTSSPSCSSAAPSATSSRRRSSRPCASSSSASARTTLRSSTSRSCRRSTASSRPSRPRRPSGTCAASASCPTSCVLFLLLPPLPSKLVMLILALAPADRMSLPARPSAARHVQDLDVLPRRQ